MGARKHPGICATCLNWRLGVGCIAEDWRGCRECVCYNIVAHMHMSVAAAQRGTMRAISLLRDGVDPNGRMCPPRGNTALNWSTLIIDSEREIVLC